MNQIKLSNILFTVAILVLQIVFTTTTYFNYQYFLETNELAQSGLFCGYYDGFYLLFFIFIISTFQLFTTINLLKFLGKILLILLVIAQIIDNYFGVNFISDAIFNTAWFTAALAIFITTILLLKFGVVKLRALSKVSKNEK